MSWKKIVIISSASIVVGFFSHDLIVSEKNISDVAPINSAKVPELSAKEVNNSSSAKQFAACATAKEEASSHSENVESNSTYTTQLNTLNAQLEQARHEIAMLKASQKFQPGKDFSVSFKQIENKFKSEQRDVEWAPIKEKEISSIFQQNQKLSGLALKNMECKTEQCQIVLAANGLEEANKNFELLFQALGEKGEYVSLVASPDVERSTTTLYVSREGKDFEFK